MEFSKVMLDLITFDRLLALFGIFTGGFLFVASVACTYGKQRMVCLAAAILSVALMATTVMPIGAEEYTNIVTIEGVSSSMWTSGEAYFSVNGETKTIEVREGQELVYKLLEGHEVELSYGKVRTLLFNRDRYVLTGIQLVNPDDASEEMLAALMSLRTN